MAESILLVCDLMPQTFFGQSHNTSTSPCLSTCPFQDLQKMKEKEPYICQLGVLHLPMLQTCELPPSTRLQANLDLSQCQLLHVHAWFYEANTTMDSYEILVVEVHASCLPRLYVVPPKTLNKEVIQTGPGLYQHGSVIVTEACQQS